MLKTRRKASKKELILQKAAGMFLEKGFSATSMRDLAEAVGIEAASLYNHIRSKSEILEDIISRTADDCNIHLDELIETRGTTISKIESVIRFHIKMMMERFEDYYVMTHEWIHLPEPQLSTFTRRRRRYVQQLETIVDEGIRKGELKPILPYVAVLTILSSVRGLEYWQRSRKQISASEMEENMVLHLISGLKK